jgi:hypothetical protein
MASFYPRTATVRLPSLLEYRAVQKRRARSRRVKLDAVARLAGQHASAAAGLVTDLLAAGVVRAFDRLVATEPVMPRHLREEVYAWLALMPGFRGKEKVLRKQFERILEQKVERDLL